MRWSRRGRVWGEPVIFRLGAIGIVPIVMLALWVYCILDVIATDDALVRNLSKGMWLLIVIFLPDIGSLAWLLLGRPLYAGWRPGDTTRRPTKRVIGPEDRDGKGAETGRLAMKATREGAQR